MATITLDLVWDRPPWWVTEEGAAPEDVDLIASEAGSWYLVEDVRQVRSKIHPSRFRFTVRRLGRFKGTDRPEEFSLNSRVIHFYWHRR